MGKIHDVTKESEEMNDEVRRFNLIVDEMSTLHAKKNKDYGSSFEESINEDGLVVSKIRLGDKYNRFKTLIKQEAEVKDESIRDTLIDLAVYAAKTVAWLDARDSND